MRRFSPLILVFIAVVALSVATTRRFTPRLVWNASASAPIGLYRIDKRAAQIGDFVLVDAAGAPEALIKDRGYLPADIPLLKRVCALPGAEICRKGEAIFIEKIHAADALLTDSTGRKMPAWTGCLVLQSDEIFLLNAPERSLDGRYFGATKLRQVTGVAIPVFVRDDRLSPPARKAPAGAR